MTTLWKTLLPVLVLIPLASYAAGTMSRPDGADPSPRETIVIDVVAEDEPARDGKRGAKDDDDRPDGRKDDSDDGGDDDGSDDDADDTDDTSGFDLVTAEPDEWTDGPDTSSHTHDRHDTRGDDRSGSNSGPSSSSGSGSSGSGSSGSGKSGSDDTRDRDDTSGKDD